MKVLDGKKTYLGIILFAVGHFFFGISGDFPEYSNVIANFGGLLQSLAIGFGGVGFVDKMKKAGKLG